MGENLVKAVFMSVYRRLAANSIRNQVKRGGIPKPFGQGCPKRCLSEITSKFNNFAVFNFG